MKSGTKLLVLNGGIGARSLDGKRGVVTSYEDVKKYLTGFPGTLAGQFNKHTIYIKLDEPFKAPYGTVKVVYGGLGDGAVVAEIESEVSNQAMGLGLQNKLFPDLEIEKAKTSLADAIKAAFGFDVDKYKREVLGKDTELTEGEKAHIKAASEIANAPSPVNDQYAESVLDDSNVVKYTTTIDKIKSIASRGATAHNHMLELFPEAFENEQVFCKVGTVLKRKSYPKNFYCVVFINGKVRMLNITGNKFWDADRHIPVNRLKFAAPMLISVSEFKHLIGSSANINDFEIVK